MRALRFHEHGKPIDVLRLEEAPVLTPGPGQIRVAVQACGLNPADWALCGGLFTGELPRGIGLEVSGSVDALGDGVSGVAGGSVVSVGDAVFGPAPFQGPSAGASDFALLDRWYARPAGLDPIAAAALPMAVETACRGMDSLGVRAGSTVLVHGAGTTVGYAAVQIALLRGARVIATAGSTYASALRSLGVQVTAYGYGMVERVNELAGGTADLVFDAAPFSEVLHDLVQIAGAPDRVLTLGPSPEARRLGVRYQYGSAQPVDVLDEFARLAAAGRFTIPVAGTFPLSEWRTAAEQSLSGHAHGKLILQIS